MAKTPWPTVIDRHQANGWHARALVTAVELPRESIVLNHCVGGGFYATLCREGRCGIFRVQPDNIADDDINGQRQYATTLEIGRDQGGWYVRQHKGFRNRRVSPEEDARAQELPAAAAKYHRRKMLGHRNCRPLGIGPSINPRLPARNRS